MNPVSKSISILLTSTSGESILISPSIPNFDEASIGLSENL
jgi:hypothetical protein